MDGMEAHLQALLAEHTAVLGTGFTLVHREYPTAIGPVDLTCREADGSSVVVEVKRRGEIDGVEQLARYLELLNRDGLRGFHGRGDYGAGPRTVPETGPAACARGGSLDHSLQDRPPGAPSSIERVGEPGEFALIH